MTHKVPQLVPLTRQRIDAQLEVVVLHLLARVAVADGICVSHRGIGTVHEQLEVPHPPYRVVSHAQAVLHIIVGVEGADAL